MKKQFTPQLLCRMLSVSVLLCLLFATVSFGFAMRGEASEPEIVTETDSFGATIRTERGDDYTEITYSMTAGSAGTSGNYLVGECATIRENFHQGSRGKAVVYRFPLVFSENLESVSLTAKLGVSGLYRIYASVDNESWVEIIGETNEAKVPTTGGNGTYNTLDIDEQSGIVNTVTQAVKKALGDGTAKYFYVRIVHPTDWNAPKVFGIDATVRYNTTWESKTETDSYGATVTTVEKGTDYTEAVYSMTAGTGGTSGGYCVSIGSEGKARDDAYCGGKGSGGVIYKIPLLFSDSLLKASLSATVGYKYGIDISLDGSVWTEVVPDNDNSGKKAIEVDLSETVKATLGEQDASALYIRFYHDSDWNAPMVYSLSVNVTYNCRGTSETVTDEYGASVLTVQTDKYKKVVTAFTAVTGDQNYYTKEYDETEIGFYEPVINGKNQYVTDWGRMVIYRYSIADAANLEELWWEANISQQVLLEVTTNKKVSSAADLGIYKEGADAVWTAVYRYESETEGVEDAGLPETHFSVNLADFIEFDASVDTVYVRISDAYYNNGWGAKFGGTVSSTAWYDYGTAGEFAVAEDAVKEIVFGKGSIAPSEWLMCKYTVARTQKDKERAVDTSQVDIEWKDMESGRSLGSRTPTAPGRYAVTVTKNADWGLRFEVAPQTFEGFIINCDHSMTGYVCNETEHWLACDGCGLEIEGTREAHTREGGFWQWNESEHWFCCKCESYDFEYGKHEFGEWKSDLMKHWRVCGDCGYQPESGLHNWDDGVVTTPSTVTETGVKTITCKDCGRTKTQTIEKLTESETTTDPNDNTGIGTEKPNTGDNTGSDNRNRVLLIGIVGGVVVVAGITIAVILSVRRRKFKKKTIKAAEKIAYRNPQPAASAPRKAEGKDADPCGLVAALAGLLTVGGAVLAVLLRRKRRK